MSATLRGMQNTTEAELLQQTQALGQMVQLGEWVIEAKTLGGVGTPIDEVLARGGTFYGREVLNAWRFLRLRDGASPTRTR